MKMSKEIYKNKTILITGGTGSFGKAFVKYLIKKKFGLKKIIIFSRDELKQFEMQNEFSSNENKILRFFLGDIRDYERLKTALENVDYVIHAAALKQVPAAEYNPIEFVKTNVLGTQNIIQACLERSVKKSILLSTDKASSPINLYGATKLCADKLFISANNIKGSKKISFSVVRYGNVMGSRGSVVYAFKKQIKDHNKVFLTDKNMTRFNILLEDGIKLVLWTLQNSIGGEIVVPKLKSFRIIDLAKSMGAKKILITGSRPGEKIHEEMISINESINTIEQKNRYIILPEFLKNYYKNKGKKLSKIFCYNSFDNSEYLNQKNLKDLVKNLKI